MNSDGNRSRRAQTPASIGPSAATHAEPLGRAREQLRRATPSRNQLQALSERAPVHNRAPQHPRRRRQEDLRSRERMGKSAPG